MTENGLIGETPEGVHAVRNALLKFVEDMYKEDDIQSIEELQLGIIQFAGASLACGVEVKGAASQMEWSIRNFIMAFQATLEARGIRAEVDIEVGVAPQKGDLN